MLRILYLSFLGVAIVVYAVWDGGDLFRSHDTEGELRRQFHIPDGVEIAKVHRTGREHCWGGGILTGEVRFTDQAFEAYRARLHDPSIWQPVPLNHFSTDLRDYTFDSAAIEWRQFPQAGGGQSSLRFRVSDGGMLDAGPGRVLCYGIHVPTPDLVGTPEGTGYMGIQVAPCDAPGYGGKPKAFVLGHLDEGGKTLRMRIQLTNPPRYCTKARRRPFLGDDVFGLNRR